MTFVGVAVTLCRFDTAVYIAMWIADGRVAVELAAIAWIRSGYMTLHCCKLFSGRHWFFFFFGYLVFLTVLRRTALVRMQTSVLVP